MVAIGKVHNTGEKAHTVSQREGFMQVGIDIAIEDSTRLPVPNEDADTYVIKQAVGAVVSWPIHLIVINVPVLTLLTMKLTL